MKRTVDKLTLNNFLRHVDAHNKIQEEREMWRQRELERKSEYEKVEWPKRGPLLVRGRLVSDAFDDLDEDGGTVRSAASRAPTSTYWTRRLMKAEENDPFRWGHSGFKEQNPEEFISTGDEDSHVGSADTERKSHKKKKHKKQKHKETHPSGESSDEDQTEHKHEKKKRKTSSKKEKKKKTKATEVK